MASLLLHWLEWL